MISILIADDHELMRQGVRSLLESNPDFDVCGEARDGVEAVAQTAELRPDVVVLDVSMPNLNGLDAARQIRDRFPDTRILIFTINDTDEMVRRMLECGAHGYILKSDAAAHLNTAVEAVAQNDLYFSSGVSDYVMGSMMNSYENKGDMEPEKSPLTTREIEIVKLLAEGKSNKEIATLLFISVRTVETHRRTIHRKLRLNSVADLVRYAIRHRLVRV